MGHETGPAPAIVVSDTVCKSFGPVVAIENVSLAVREGQFVTIVGPSGCGKSTLLQILGGLVAPSSGEIRIDNEPLTGPRPDKIGMVFQEPLLLPWKTAAENVEFPLLLRHVPAKERRERSLALLDLVGLAGSVGRYPHQLSGGMKQRVAIARGLVQGPRIVLMDEPFAALDEQTRSRMWGELLRIWERSRATILFVTHGLIEAIYLADTVLVMGIDPGRIIARIEVPLPRPRQLEMVGFAGSRGASKPHLGTGSERPAMIAMVLNNAWIRRIVIATVCVALWELAFRAGLLNPVIFGSPSLVLQAAISDGALFLQAFRITLIEIALAALIACVGGVLFGVVFGAFPIAALTLVPILSAIIAVPLVVFYPVLVVWFGIGPPSKVVYGALIAFFPIALTTMLGVRAVDPSYAVMATAMGASRWRALVSVTVPLALPAVIAGLRIGLAFIIISVVQGEMVAAFDGLGFWISYHRTIFNTGHVYLGIILTLVLAVGLNAILSRLEQRYSGWRAQTQITL